MTEASVCHISSTVAPDGRAACLLEWGPIRALLTPATVLTTSRDLMAAAVRAETDIALIQVFREGLKLDLPTIGHMIRDIRAQRPAPTGKTALRIEAVAGARTGQPLVHISRGSMKGELSPDEARAMAQQWTEAAVAAAIDVRLRYALGEWGHLTEGDIERLFTILQELQGP